MELQKNKDNISKEYLSKLSEKNMRENFNNIYW